MRRRDRSTSPAGCHRDATTQARSYPRSNHRDGVPAGYPDSCHPDMLGGIVRTFIVLILSLIPASNCAFAQSPLTKILLDELTRNFTILKQRADPPPYFMGYAVTETEANVVEASGGSIDEENQGRVRELDVTVRTGDPT